MLRRWICLCFLALCFSTAAYAGPDQWVEVRSARFTVVTDAGEKQGRHLADQFERMRWVFQTLYPKTTVDPPEPIIVIAAKNQKVFQTMEPAAYLAKGQLQLGGYYSHTLEKNYILLRLDAEYDHPFATVYHEYTHLQFMGAAAWMPLWLNEGLAELMQNTEIHDKDAILYEPSADDIHYLQQVQMIPLSVLFKVDGRSPYYHEEQKGSVFYAESWALTHLLVINDHEKNTHRVADYLNLVGHNLDPVTAAEKAFGDLKDLQSDLVDYVHRGTYISVRMSAATAPIDESTYKVRLLTQAEFDARRADVLCRADREDEARTLLQQVLIEDPNNAQAHETMGLLESRAGHFDEARKWYQEAVKLDSSDYLAYYQFASFSMNDPSGADDKAIEDSLRKAIQLNPQFAPSYDRLAGFYAMRHENLDEAHLLSIQAVQLDPSEVVFRINAANVLITMQQYDAAVNVLKVAEKVAKNPEQIARVENQIAQVEGFQKQRAEAEEARKANEDSEVVTLNGEQPASAPATRQIISVTAKPPKHPTVPETGRKHIATGTIHNVVCSFPAVVEFHLETTAGKSLALYNNDFSKLDLSAVKAVSGTVDPCADFEGKKVELEYVDSPDKTVTGEVIAVMLKN